MNSRTLGMLALGVTAFLAACGTPAQVPTSSPEGAPPLPPPLPGVTVPVHPSTSYTVLDNRTYFHQHYGATGFSNYDDVYVQSLGGWRRFSLPEHWGAISGMVYGNLGTYGDKSWYYIPSPYQGIVWSWSTGLRQWQRKNAGYFGQALAYVS